VLTSMVALCTIRFRQSKRLAQDLLSTMLNVDLSLGAISKMEQQTSEALAAPVEEAREYVREQAVVNADETGWYEGKAEGRKQRAWLWVVTTSLVTVFQIAKSRGEDVAREMVGEFKGVLGVDRWSAYNFVDVFHRQLCWSHLKRDFLSFVDRGGKGAEIGAALLRQVDLMFTWWHRVRDGTLTHRNFQRRMEPVKEEIRRLLRAAVVRAEPKTRGMAKAILKLKWALFTFVREPGVEPTNNVSERRVRPAVIARKLSFGTESPAGSRFVERMLTTTTTLRQQDRNVLEYLVAAHEARLYGRVAPSLLPSAT
jgi:transposase